MNRRFCAQVSDRRISTAGVPIDEESNKAVVLMCRDGRFLFGYSGLATYEGFQTHKWLVDALFEVAPPDYTIKGIIERFIDRATRDFSSLPALSGLNPGKRRLTVMCAGFLSTPNQRAVAVLISNFQDFGAGIVEKEARATFNRFHERERSDAEGPITWVQRIGRYDKVSDKNTEDIRRLLREDKPAHASVDLAVSIIGDIAVRYPNAGVGSQMMSIIVPADLSKNPSTGYHTGGPSHSGYMPSCVFATGPRNHHAVLEPRLQALDPNAAPPLVVQRVGRNHPCPCKSGQKYKRCHGRHSPGTAAA